MARGKIIFTDEQRSFLLSGEARALKPKDAAALKDDEAYERFKAVRWSWQEGRPECPWCGATKPYELATRRGFKCASCGRHFSTTTGTVFRARKLPYRTLLQAISIRLHRPTNPHVMAHELGITCKPSYRLAKTFRTFLGAVDYLPGNIKPLRPSENRWPYANSIRGEAADLVTRVNKAVSYALPEQVRSDVAQDIILAVITGECPETQIEEHVRQYVTRHYRTFEQGYGVVSLNQPIPGTDIERISTLTYDDMPWR